MIGPRRAIFLGLLALSVLWPLSSVRADQAFQRFLPLLVDLDGWQGKKPDGMSMEMPEYDHDHRDARLSARPSASACRRRDFGLAAAGALAPLLAGMNVRRLSDGHMVTSTMHGLQVIKTFNTPQKSGAIQDGARQGSAVQFFLQWHH